MAEGVVEKHIRETIGLEPGEFYGISEETLPINPTSNLRRIYPVMYVRQEKIQNANYHVFAGAEKDGGILTRIRAPLNRLKVDKRKEIIVEPNFLKQFSVFFAKFERESMGEHLVNSFIEQAYNLIRHGPNATTFEEDAFTLAGIYPSDKSRARLKIIIEHYHRGD